jgi:ABC-type sugar transport system permease subunit
MANQEAKRKFTKLVRLEALEFYLYTSPWIIGFIVFLLYPLASSLYFVHVTRLAQRPF